MIERATTNRKLRVETSRPSTHVKTPTGPYSRPCGGFGIYYVLFCILLLSGCTSTRALPAVPTYGTAAELLYIISTRYDSLRTLKIRSQITLKLDGIRENRATARFLYDAPDHLRIDIGTFGISIMTAIADQNVLEVYLPRENNHLVGQPEKVIKVLTGVNLVYYDLSHALLGLPNLSPLDLPRVTHFLPGQNQVFLELSYAQWARKLVFDRRSATILEDHIFSPEGKTISKRFLSEYYQTGDFLLPKHIAIHQGDDIISIDVTNHQSNIALSDSDFHMRVPGDVTRHDIE